MKTRFEIELDSTSVSTFFPTSRIKDKFRIIEIILESARYILHAKREKTARGLYKLIFFRDKMSRIFFVSDDKVYSVIFPFNLKIDNGILTLNYKNMLEIDSLALSNLIILLKNPLIQSESCLDFIDPILDLESEHPEKYWMLFKDLLTTEDGYIRYDKDLIGYNEAKKKKREHRHPIHHLDIFYTNAATFKIGLNNAIIDRDFIDTVNTETNCKYLNCP